MATELVRITELVGSITARITELVRPVSGVAAAGALAAPRGWRTTEEQSLSSTVVLVCRVGAAERVHNECAASTGSSAPRQLLSRAQRGACWLRCWCPACIVARRFIGLTTVQRCVCDRRRHLLTQRAACVMLTSSRAAARCGRRHDRAGPKMPCLADDAGQLETSGRCAAGAQTSTCFPTEPASA